MMKKNPPDNMFVTGLLLIALVCVSINLGSVVSDTFFDDDIQIMEMLDKDYVPGATLRLIESKDGYRFTGAKMNNRDGSYEIVLYEDTETLRSQYYSYTGDIRTSKRIRAFTVMKKDEAHCTIHMVSPDKGWMPEILGHEFAHCIFGEYHSGEKETGFWRR